MAAVAGITDLTYSKSDIITIFSFGSQVGTAWSTASEVHDERSSVKFKLPAYDLPPNPTMITKRVTSTSLLDLNLHRRHDLHVYYDHHNTLVDFELQKQICLYRYHYCLSIITRDPQDTRKVSAKEGRSVPRVMRANCILLSSQSPRKVKGRGAFCCFWDW